MPDDIKTCKTCSALVANAAAHARWHHGLEERVSGQADAAQKLQEELEERRAAQATRGAAQKPEEDFTSEVLRRLRG